MNELNNASLKIQTDVIDAFTKKLIEWDIPTNDFPTTFEGVLAMVNSLSEEEKVNVLSLLVTSLIVSQHDYN